MVTTSMLAELADLAYFEVDADRNVVAISPAMERLTGFSAEDVLGRSCLTLNRCPECLKSCGLFRVGEVQDMALTLFRADGSTFDVFKSGRVRLDEDGKVMGAVEVLRPVADPSAAARRGPPPELDRLLGGLGRLFLVADEEFRVVAHARGLPGLLGLEREALDGIPLEDLFGAELFGVDSVFRAAVAAGDRREGWAAELMAADGKPLPVSLTVGRLDPGATCAGGAGRYALMIRPDDRQARGPSFRGIVSRSPAMLRIFRLVELLRDNDSTVLISGESGTGKELVAHALHTTSHRKAGPFVVVNCAAIPPELLESELFGHVRGSFTGAVKDRPGRFELADGGTLFLDEIGDLALSLQGKILRFLQERTFERVGESRTRSVDVRVIAATHVNLTEAVAARRFREDLYYRLRVVPIHIPAIRDRIEDLEILVRHFMEEIGQERGRSLRLAPSASRALLTYPWPGNVRELRNALEYAMTVCEGQTIHVEDLPREVGMESPRSPDSSVPWQASRPTSPLDARGERGLNGEADRIRIALERSRYRKGDAARALGMSRTTLWRKMREYGI